MKVIFLHSKRDDERLLANTFVRGVRARGDEAVALPKLMDWQQTPPDADVIALIGVKGKPYWDAAQRAGLRTVMLDRGYFRTNDYVRVSVDHHNPAAYVATARHNSVRWDDLSLKLAPWCSPGRNVLLAGSSEKYHLWYDLLHPAIYAQGIADDLARRGARVTYRPKVGWRGKGPVRGADYHVRGNQGAGLRNFGILDALKNAHCFVTHGSNSCVEALVMGVPAVILGDGVTRGVSSTNVADWSEPRRASAGERLQALANLAWCQFSLAEFRCGVAWRHLRAVLETDPKSLSPTGRLAA